MINCSVRCESNGGARRNTDCACNRRRAVLVAFHLGSGDIGDLGASQPSFF